MPTAAQSTMLLRLLLFVALAPAAPFRAVGAAASHRSRAASSRMQVLNVDTATQVEELLASSGDAIIVLHFSESSQMLGNALVERVATEYSASKLYGGVPVAAVLVRADTAVGAPIAEARGVSRYPTTQIWQKGSMRKVNAAADLEGALLALGVRSASNRFNRASGDMALGSGLPSGTAVDDIDFTGGAGGGPIIGSGPDRGTTRDYVRAACPLVVWPRTCSLRSRKPPGPFCVRSSPHPKTRRTGRRATRPTGPATSDRSSRIGPRV